MTETELTKNSFQSEKVQPIIKAKAEMQIEITPEINLLNMQTVEVLADHEYVEVKQEEHVTMELETYEEVKIEYEKCVVVKQEENVEQNKQEDVEIENEYDNTYDDDKDETYSQKSEEPNSDSGHRREVFPNSNSKVRCV